MYIRSNDLFLGAPANIVEYAFLLDAVAHATGYTAKTFTYFVSDAHIYVNHIEQVRTQLSREPYSLPSLVYKKPYEGKRETKDVVEWLCGLHPDDFELVGYQHHPELTGEMAV
jgi:thymidylate synthase